MNTKLVNSAAGVINAALTQNRTAAGIALALESAGLLMSPEAAADIASVSTDAAGVAEQAVKELRREHEISAQLRLRVDEVVRAYTFDTAELKRQLDTERVDGQRLIRAEQRRAELEAVLETHRKDDQAEIERLRARVAELEQREKYRADTLERCRADAAEQAERETDPERRAMWQTLAGGASHALRDDPFGLHHSYRVPRDLPEMGGSR